VPTPSTVHDDRPRNRLLRKKILTPVALAVIGVALLAGAINLYTSPSELPTPPYATLALSSTFPIQNIFYTVDQVSPAIAELQIGVELPSGRALPPVGASIAHMLIIPPFGTHFRTCPRYPGAAARFAATPYCLSTSLFSENLFIWVQPLIFKTFRGPLQTPPFGAAYAQVFVKAHSFGKTFNGVTASAAIPSVTYNDSGTPILETQYTIPSASSYDWSAFPTQFANGTIARWNEQVNGGTAEGRAAVGVNHANQSDDDNKTFVAGALLGLAGAAFLSAVQEALHPND
jgi:hypothetical protein